MSYLDQLVIAAPCTVSWDSMQGDNSVRLCSGCNRNVYNISDMSKNEAEAFLRKNSTSQCMRFFRRHDGTILTANCPKGLRTIQRRFQKVAVLLAGLISSFAFSELVEAQDSSDTSGAINLKNGEKLPKGFSGYHSGRMYCDGTDITEQEQSGGGGLMIVPLPQQRSFTPIKSIWEKLWEGFLGINASKKSLSQAPATVISTNQKQQVRVKRDDQSHGDATKLGSDAVVDLSEPIHGDKSVFKLLIKARANALNGKLFLAQVQYEQAYELTKKNHDPKFSQLVKTELDKLNSRFNPKSSR